MDDKQLEKRMELLKKSYDRLEPQLDPEAVFTQIELENEVQQEQENPLVQKPPSKWQKSAVWMVSIASVLLVSVLVSSYVIQQPVSLSSEEKALKEDEKKTEEKDWVERLTKKYKSKKEQIRRELSVSIDELNAFQFIKNADSMLEFYTKNNLRLQESDEQYLKDAEENVLNELTTPRRALEAINGRDLIYDESFTVYLSYEQSVIELEEFYSGLLEPFQPLLKKSPDININKYPELKVIIDAANAQFMELRRDENGSFYFKADPINGEYRSADINNLHPDIFGYFEYLEKGYLLLADDLRYTREDTARSLKIIERTLLADKNPDSTAYKVLRETFENTWLVLLKGSPKYPAYNGKLHVDHLNFLRDVADGKYGELMKEMAGTVIKELEKSNNSTTLSKLSSYDMWTIILQTREETTGLINDSDFIIVDINDQEMMQIEAVYEQYKKSDSETFINQLRPLNIVSLYLYAKSIDDKSLEKALVLPDAKLDSSLLGNVKNLDVVSQLGEYDGSYPMVAIRIESEQQNKYGRQFLVKLSKNKEGYNRISGIID
ncbi:hypothetical protein [Lysinibacillus pakistanensis]|uniref:Uncharacterized protein n=1 Tax=Lysinibacillus pakistanensis TaxID=759811 RepID=A0AAX3WS31_9BACI|nr:hypothetical protein [Lysinibacillus pakistanensis]MDM5230039.1 hypothetical protein [Lysinibacillus pakistanensis]WHY45637.1 hypothetical protein QNH22_20535 [Lysinibacillus pakistanensis]WHY50645.1 hypothetical protein QNH24_20500 [Lysinibacillus pakistanensis]